MRSGQILEDTKFADYRRVFLKVTRQSSHIQYAYRMIFFPDRSLEPILSLNLEYSSGFYFLGAHVGDHHENHGDADQNMSAQAFKTWALNMAGHYLGFNPTPPPTPTARTTVLDGNHRSSEHREVPKSDLASVASDLAEKMRIERESWYSECCQMMRIIGQGFEPSKASIHLAELKGSPEQTIKAFQFVHVLSFIYMKEYVGTRIGDLTRLLCNRVCASDWNECRPFVDRYTALKQEFIDQFPRQFLGFSEDLALAIGKGAMGMLLAPAIDMTVGAFYWRNLLHAARIFNDRESVDSISEIIHQHNSESTDKQIRNPNGGLPQSPNVDAVPPDSRAKPKVTKCPACHAEYPGQLNYCANCGEFMAPPSSKISQFQKSDARRNIKNRWSFLTPLNWIFLCIALVVIGLLFISSCGDGVSTIGSVHSLIANG